MPTPLPDHLQATFDWLATAREPRSTQEIWDELTLMGTRTPPDGLPTTVARLANAMVALMMKGFVEEKAGVWHPVRQPTRKVEKTLF